MSKPASLLVGIFTLAWAAVGLGAGVEYDFALHTYPNPFVPGFEPANIYYVLPADSVISLRVYDFDGNLLRVIIEDAARFRGEHEGEESWDGSDAAAEIARPGPYVMILEVAVLGKIYRDSFVVIVNR